jgi:hypothetical protein
MTRPRARNRMAKIAVTAAIAVGVAGCLYGFLAYSSLRTEFRSLGLR